MTTTGDLRTSPPAAITPRRRRVAVWVLIGIVLVAVAALGSVLSLGQWAERDALDPESPGPQGTRALVQLLSIHGVEVTVVRDRASADAALEGGRATLVLPDSPYLADDALRELSDAAADVVLIDPRARGLRVLFPGAQPRGVAGTSAIAPDCESAEARRAGPVTIGGVFTAGDAAVGCYPVDEAFGVLIRDGAIALDGRAIATNEHLADAGNAALAVAVTGRHPTLVWYVPSISESQPTGQEPSLGELTPRWVSPAIVLLLLAGVAAALWRGRRFGPLVVERLPVTVRSSETTEGRGRLYARSRDAVHAADQLRIGTLGRLARMLALGAAASAPHICDATAARVGADRAVVRGILIDELPTTDAELVSLSDRLRELENAVRSATSPERNHP